MEHYEVYYRDTFLGMLTVDTAADRYAYVPCQDAVAQVKEEVALIREMVEGTAGFVPPIPFFQSRLRNMRRFGLSELHYHTDYFCIKRCDP